MSVAWRALIVAVAACAAYGCAPRAASPPPSPSTPPFVAWLERDAERATVVVVPTLPLSGPIHLAIRAGAEATRAAILGPRGGRVDLSAARAARLEVEATWRDPRGIAAARALLADPPPPDVTAPAFVTILGFRPGRSGPAVDQAVRLR